MLASRLQKLRVPPGGNQILTRTLSPVVTTSIIVAPDKPKPSEPIIDDFIPLKGGSSDSDPIFLAGNPIEQLERSRNPAPRQIAAEWRFAKNGDYEYFAQGLDISKTHPDQIARFRNRIERLHENALIQNTGKAYLGAGLNGHQVYAAPRFKPTLANGRADISAQTGRQGFTGSYLLTRAPAVTQGNLEAESYTANFGPSSGGTTMPVERKTVIAVNTSSVRPSTYNYDEAIQKETPTSADLEKNGGKMIFLIAAVFIAWLVLGRN